MGKAVLSGAGRARSQYIPVTPVVPEALSSAVGELYGSTPFEGFMGRQPRTQFYSARSQEDDGKVAVGPYGPERVRGIVTELARGPEELLNEVRVNM